MNWYRITPCPDYAISEDGLQIKSLKSNKILNHNSSAKAKDGIRRVTLRYTCIYQNKFCRKRITYPITFLKQYIKKENKL